jgi:hypothetical protein
MFYIFVNLMMPRSITTAVKNTRSVSDYQIDSPIPHVYHLIYCCIELLSGGRDGKLQELWKEM